MAKPIGALELHYPMIQFLIICIIPGPVSYYPKKKPSYEENNPILGVNGLNSKLKHRIAQMSILFGRLQEILESWPNMQYESGWTKAK